MRFGTLKNITNDKNNIGIYEIKNGNKNISVHLKILDVDFIVINEI